MWASLPCLVIDPTNYKWDEMDQNVIKLKNSPCPTFFFSHVYKSAHTVIVIHNIIPTKFQFNWNFDVYAYL